MTVTAKSAEAEQLRECLTSGLKPWSNALHRAERLYSPCPANNSGALTDIIGENERSVTGAASLRDIFHVANKAPAFLSLLLAKEMNSNLTRPSFNGIQHLRLLLWFIQLYLA